MLWEAHRQQELIWRAWRSTVMSHFIPDVPKWFSHYCPFIDEGTSPRTGTRCPQTPQGVSVWSPPHPQVGAEVAGPHPQGAAEHWWECWWREVAGGHRSSEFPDVGTEQAERLGCQQHREKECSRWGRATTQGGWALGTVPLLCRTRARSSSNTEVLWCFSQRHCPRWGNDRPSWPKQPRSRASPWEEGGWLCRASGWDRTQAHRGRKAFCQQDPITVC